MKKVLVPTDFSKCAEVALVQALAFAKLNRAELHVVHALPNYANNPYIPLQSGDWKQFLLGQESHANNRLDELLDCFDCQGVQVVRHLPRAEAVAPAILSVEQEIDPALIVIGAYGERGFRRLLFGSVTQEIVRLASCPVMTVRETTQPIFDLWPQHMVVPLDLSEHSRLALRVAKELARPDSKLDLIHVLELPSSHLYDEPLPGHPAGAAQPETLARIEQAVARFVEKTEGPDVTSRIRILDGRVAEAISDYAEGAGADLIVMATRGLSDLPQLLLGSVAERLLRLATCPVLTLKTDAEKSEGEQVRVADSVLVS